MRLVNFTHAVPGGCQYPIYVNPEKVVAVAPLANGPGSNLFFSGNTRDCLQVEESPAVVVEALLEGSK